MNQKGFGQVLITFLFLFIVFPSDTTHAAQPLAPGMSLPEFTLPGPDPEAQKYLGLTSPKPFPLSEVPARAVLIETFYVLCMECQKAAPGINKLYSLLQSDPELARNLKMFGLGIRGDEKRLRAFRTQYHTKFPLLPDPENEVYEKLGEPKIPFLMLVNKSGKVLFTHSGAIEDVDNVFSEIKKLAMEQ